MSEVRVEAPKKWVPWLYGTLSLAVVAAVYVGLAEMHHDTLRLEVRDGAVLVEKGYYAPTGWGAYRPSEAFKPVKVDADVPVRVGECADLEDCEARLFDVAARQARRYLGRRESLREAGALIAQAVKLSGPSTREQMLELQGDEQYLKGLMALEDAERVLEDALKHFERARAMGTHSFRDVDTRLASLEAAKRALKQKRASAAPAPPPVVVPTPPSVDPPQMPEDADEPATAPKTPAKEPESPPLDAPGPDTEVEL